MIVDKVTSSPTLLSRGISSLPVNNKKFDAFDPADKDQPVNNAAEDAPDASELESTNVTELESSEENELPKAAFYIGDESIYNSPARRRKEFEGVMNGQQQFLLPKPPQTPNAVDQKQNEPKEKNEPPEFIPPDGGYGWVIALSACFVNFFIVGFIKSYGVLYLSFMKKFPNASNYQASWLPVFLSTSGLLIAPITGILCRRFTSRKVSIVGGLFAFTGIALGAFANSMLQTILTFGLLTGIGAGLTATPGVLITSLYFENRQALASAICVSGNAIGGFVFPPLMEYLLNTYGLQGTLLIAAAMQLNICAVSLLYRPIRVHALMQQKKSQKAKTSSKDQSKGALWPLPTNTTGRSLSKCDSLLNKISSKKVLSTASFPDDDEEELRHHVSFLRSASLLNSIPDLSEYARSWCSDQNSAIKPQQSIKFSHKCSKASIANMATNNRSHMNLERQISAQESQNNSYGVLMVERNPSLRSNNARSCSRLSGDEVVQPFLIRDISKKKRTKPLSSLPEMDVDSQTSLSDLDVNEKEKKENEAVSFDGQHIDGNLDTNQINMKNKEVDVETAEVTTKKPKQKIFDFSLFKTSTFWLVGTSVTLIAAGAPHAMFFLPAYAASANIEKGTIIYLMSASSVVDLVGRLGIGFFSDLKLIRYAYLYAVAAMMAGVALLVIPFLNSIAGIGVFLGMYGFGVGAWFVLIPPILASHHGSKKIASSYGLVRMFHGIMNIISPQVSGILIDASGNYKSIYYFMGSSMICGGLLMFFEPIVVSIEWKKRKQEYLS